MFTVPTPSNVAASPSTDALLTRPLTAITCRPGTADAPAIRHSKCPCAARSGPTVTPKPNWEKGAAPSSVPRPPPFATVGPAAPAAAGSMANNRPRMTVDKPKRARIAVPS